MIITAWDLVAALIIQSSAWSTMRYNRFEIQTNWSSVWSTMRHSRFGRQKNRSKHPPAPPTMSQRTPHHLATNHPSAHAPCRRTTETWGRARRSRNVRHSGSDIRPARHCHRPQCRRLQPMQSLIPTYRRSVPCAVSSSAAVWPWNSSWSTWSNTTSAVTYPARRYPVWRTEPRCKRWIVCNSTYISLANHHISVWLPLYEQNQPLPPTVYLSSKPTNENWYKIGRHIFSSVQSLPRLLWHNSFSSVGVVRFWNGRCVFNSLVGSVYIKIEMLSE